MRHSLNYVKPRFNTSPCLTAAGAYAWPSDLMKRFLIALAAVGVIAIAAFVLTSGDPEDSSGNNPVDIPNDRIGSGIR